MGILKRIIQQTTGGPNNVAQTFISNNFASPEFPKVSPYVLDVPTFSFTGGTIYYYSQDPNSIFTSLSNPFIRFTFTGNTHNLTGDTLIIHEVYKIKYDLFSKLIQEFQFQESTLEEEDNSIEETETITQDGVSTTKTISKKSFNQKNTSTSISKAQNFFDELKFNLEKPVHTFSAATSAITSNIYEFIPTTVIKPINEDNVLQPSEKLFEDRGQYFVNTYFRFSKDTLSGFEDQQQLDIEQSTTGAPIIITGITINHPQHFMTGYDRHSITASTFSGVSVQGSFFSYFEVPGKPKMEEPYVEGNLTTLSPRFYFSNVSDGDEYQLDVVYSTNDTGFTGTVFTSKIAKDLVDGIQEFTVSLRTNSEFSYRVGNVKKIKNIFGIDQKVVTFSEVYTAKTQTQPASIYVYASSDSPYVADIPVLSTPPSILNEAPLGYYSLSGIVSGSIVTGATVTLTYPNGNSISQSTSLIGEYRFTGLTEGNYVLTTNYRGYKTDSRTIAVNSDTASNFTLKVIWGNAYETFGDFANYTFGDNS